MNKENEKWSMKYKEKSALIHWVSWSPYLIDMIHTNKNFDHFKKGEPMRLPTRNFDPKRKK